MNILDVPIEVKEDNDNITWSFDFCGDHYEQTVPKKEYKERDMHQKAKFTIQRELVKELHKAQISKGKYKVVAVVLYKQEMEKLKEPQDYILIATAFLDETMGWEGEQFFFTNDDRAMDLAQYGHSHDSVVFKEMLKK